MAELADAHGSGPCGSNTMRVQVPLSALYMVAFHQYGETLFLYNRIKVSKDHTCNYILSVLKTDGFAEI